MKKFVTILLVISLLGAMLIGCNTNNEATDASDKGKVSATDTKDEKAPENSDELVISEPNVFPVTNKPVDLTLFVNTRLGVDNYEDNAYSKWLEEQTGLNLNFIVAPEQSKTEKLNVLMSSGDYPDAIFGVLTPAQIKLYGEQGILLKLNDFIDTHGVRTQELFESYPPAKEIATMPDGSIYALPDVNACYHCSFSTKMWMYMPWLETLGLDVPTTTDEYYNVLKAFKENDPNGNGEQDEIALMGSHNGWNSLPHQFLMNSFVYYDHTKKGLYVNDGKVTAAFAEDGFKEGLKYLNMLYSEGLLAGESYTQDNNILKQYAENEIPIVGSIPSGYMGMFTQISSSDRWKDYRSLAPLEGPTGMKYSQWSPYDGAYLKFTITSACEYPLAAFKMADFMYSSDNTHRMVFGREGEEWRYLDEDSGIEGINGKPAKYEVLVNVDEQPMNVSWNQVALGIRTSDVRLSAAANEASAFEKVLYEDTANQYNPYAPDINMVIPPLYFTEEQSTELLPLETTINDFVKEMIARFITGDVSVESGWEEYINELDKMGVEKLVSIYQAALDQ